MASLSDRADRGPWAPQRARAAPGMWVLLISLSHLISFIYSQLRARAVSEAIRRQARQYGGGAMTILQQRTARAICGHHSKVSDETTGWTDSQWPLDDSRSCRKGVGAETDDAYDLRTPEQSQPRGDDAANGMGNSRRGLHDSCSSREDAGGREHPCTAGGRVSAHPLRRIHTNHSRRDIAWKSTAAPCATTTSPAVRALGAAGGLAADIKVSGLSSFEFALTSAMPAL
jgi:hypothetical protein